MNRYFDIALNLASERFSGERDKVIANALTNNVNYFNIVCSSLNELDFVKDLNTVKQFNAEIEKSDDLLNSLKGVGEDLGITLLEVAEATRKNGQYKKTNLNL